MVYIKYGFIFIFVAFIARYERVDILISTRFSFFGGILNAVYAIFHSKRCDERIFDLWSGIDGYYKKRVINTLLNYYFFCIIGVLKARSASHPSADILLAIVS